MNRTILAIAMLVLYGPAPSHAVDAATCGFSQGSAGWYSLADRSGPYALDGNCNATLIGAGGGGGGGGGGSVTAAGTNGSLAQAIQGINGGVAVGVSAASWPLPTGAATAAAQATGNTSLAAIDAKTPALVGGRQPVDGSGVTQPVVGGPPASASFAVAKTGSIGTTAVQVSAADAAARRTVRNTGSVACEIMPGATAYGTGHPLPVGESFTFDASGRTTAALFAACASAGGAVSVISF